MESGYEQVRNYQQLVLRYEALNLEIHRLLEAHGGVTEHLPPAELTRYRGLARQRDEALNEMRWLEHLLMDEDTNV